MMHVVKVACVILSLTSSSIMVVLLLSDCLRGSSLIKLPACKKKCLFKIY